MSAQTPLPTKGYLRILGHTYFNTMVDDIAIMRFDPDNSWVYLGT
jgi:hypothetical protein